VTPTINSCKFLTTNVSVVGIKGILWCSYTQVKFMWKAKVKEQYEYARHNINSCHCLTPVSAAAAKRTESDPVVVF